MNRTRDKRQVHEEAAKEQARRKDPAAPGPSAQADVPSASPAVFPPPPAPPGAALPTKESQAESIAALEDQLLRLRADFDNFRKRTLREKTELYDSATSDLMLELLPVLDHLQLALHAAAAHQAIRDGLRLIFEQLMGVLAKFGLEPFDTEKQVFDPARCEAIGRLASEAAPEGVVLTQTRRGYLLRNKLLRAAQVVVSGGPTEDCPPKSGQPHDLPPPAAAKE